MRLTLLSILILFSCVACNKKVPAQKKHHPLQVAIEKMGDELEKATLEDDWELIFSYHAEDVVLMPNFHKPIKGKKAWRKIEEKARHKKRKFKSISYTTQEVWSCDSLVYEIGNYGMSMINSDLSLPFADYGTYFTIWEKQNDGSLKIKKVIWNTDQEFNAIYEQVK